MPAPKGFVSPDKVEETVQEEEVPMSNFNTKTYKVRLRNETIPLPVSATGEVDGRAQTLRASLIPNQWTTVPEAIYNMLKAKFALKSDVSRMVPDAVENERHPHAKGEEAIMREESKPGYIIEFN